MEKSEAKTTPKRVLIRPMYSASVALSKQVDKNEEINQVIISTRAKNEEIITNLHYGIFVLRWRRFLASTYLLNNDNM